ncbi:hypothetical protein Cgig2_002729 [Carnegiea gigantea]|uniref:Uncharacterized protein n=1 Tax=Carnegiea gigantea TaxID=171969 RepID=A0A9Q1GTX7_9CARY|nr:hypothetical protein Cgig2_002729 [Carnegiea gigantea]
MHVDGVIVGGSGGRREVVLYVLWGRKLEEGGDGKVTCRGFEKMYCGEKGDRDEGDDVGDEYTQKEASKAAKQVGFDVRGIQCGANQQQLVGDNIGLADLHLQSRVILVETSLHGQPILFRFKAMSAWCMRVGDLPCSSTGREKFTVVTMENNAHVLEYRRLAPQCIHGICVNEVYVGTTMGWTSTWSDSL